ncbi:MAG: endolytic transglycosylase MltG [Gammaproteobacteria bacterium]
MSIKIIGFTLILIGFGGVWAWLDYQNTLNSPALKEAPVLIEINKGDSLNRIADKLAALNLAVKPFWFKVIAIQTNSAKKLKTGEYELTQGLTLPEIIELFALGKTKQYAITFPEGWNFKEILREIRKHPKLEQTLDDESTAQLMERMGAAIKMPEGQFFPDTYFFEKHMSDVSLLKRAYDKMQSVLSEEWRDKADGLPFKNPYEALILASIIEKETGTQSERPMIAGVFIRRLKNEMPLQTDPTVIYGMGDEYHGNISSRDLKTMTPYNTYLHKGLPPTPIAMPGRHAIHSVMHPDDSDSLYFVARGDGTHVFSATLKEHNRAVSLFQRKPR